MTSETHPIQSLSALLRAGLGDALAPAEGLLDMLTEDVSFEFPFAPPDGVTRLEGKAAVAAYLPRVGMLFTIEGLSPPRTMISADGNHAVLEFSGRAYANDGGLRYDQDYVSVLDLRDGRISRYRDYWNPGILLAAVGGGERLKAVLDG